MDYFYVIQGLIYLNYDVFIIKKCSERRRKTRKKYTFYPNAIVGHSFYFLFFIFFALLPKVKKNAQTIYFKQHWKDIIKIIIFGIRKEKKLERTIDSEHMFRMTTMCELPRVFQENRIFFKSAVLVHFLWC